MNVCHGPIHARCITQLASYPSCSFPAAQQVHAVQQCCPSGAAPTLHISGLRYSGVPRNVEAWLRPSSSTCGAGGPEGSHGQASWLGMAWPLQCSGLHCAASSACDASDVARAVQARPLICRQLPHLAHACRCTRCREARGQFGSLADTAMATADVHAHCFIKTCLHAAHTYISRQGHTVFDLHPLGSPTSPSLMAGSWPG